MKITSSHNHPLHLTHICLDALQFTCCILCMWVSRLKIFLHCNVQLITSHHTKILLKPRCSDRISLSKERETFRKTWIRELHNSSKAAAHHFLTYFTLFFGEIVPKHLDSNKIWVRWEVMMICRLQWKTSLIQDRRQTSINMRIINLLKYMPNAGGYYVDK